MVKVTCEKDDHKALDEFIKKYDNISLSGYVGIFADENPEEVKKAIYNEFGTHNTPARPFIEPTCRINEGNIEKKIINKFIKKNEELTGVLESISKDMVKETKKYINNLKTPPLSKNTIKKKGNDKLLIDTKKMYKAIKYKIQKER